MSFHPQSRAVLITCRCGFLVIALEARGERREIKVLLELELVIEYFADRCRDVVLVLVEESLLVDRAKIGAPLLEVIGRVAARFAYGVVMQEVFVKFGVVDRPVVVPLTEFVD